MRRLLSTLLVVTLLLGFVLPAHAFHGVEMSYAASGSNGIQVADKTLTSGSVTLANSRLSLVDGTAFVDFSEAGTLTPYLNHKLTITDSAGKKATGYIKAAGSGETLGAEQLTNTTFDNTDSWTASGSTLASVAGGQAGNCLEIAQTGGSAGYGLQNLASFPANSLFKFVGYHKNGTAQGRLLLQGGAGYGTAIAIVSENHADWTAVTQYGTALTVNGIRVALGSNGTAGQTSLWDTVSLKQVLTPSATGVTITSTPGGTTYNWASIESGFNYNDASGYTYIIKSCNLDMGINNFTPCFHGAIPDVTPASEIVLAQKHDGTNGWKLSLLSTGYLRTTINTSTYDSTETLASAGVTDGAFVKLCSVVTRQSASVAGSVQPYVNGNALGSPAAITAGVPTTVDNALALYVLGTSTTRTAGIANSFILFNRALSAAEVLSLYQSGVATADKWGSQTALTSGTLTVGKKYRINTYNADDDFTNIGAASNAAGVEFVATGTTPAHWAHSSSLVLLGATLDLEPSGITATDWQDASSNNLDASYPATGWRAFYRGLRGMLGVGQ